MTVQYVPRYIFGIQQDEETKHKITLIFFIKYCPILEGETWNFHQCFTHTEVPHMQLCSYFLLWFVFPCWGSWSLPVCVWPPSRWASFLWVETLRIDLSLSLLNRTRPGTWQSLPQSGSECTRRSVYPLHDRDRVTHGSVRLFKQLFHIYSKNSSAKHRSC